MYLNDTLLVKFAYFEFEFAIWQFELIDNGTINLPEVGSQQHRSLWTSRLSVVSVPTTSGSVQFKNN